LDIVITDSMTTGLTFNNDIKVYASIAGGAETEVTSSATTWTQAATPPAGATFQVTLDDAYIATLNTNDKVFIRFSATVNNAAVTEAKETNTSTLTYSNQSSTDTVDAYNYKFQLDKVDSSYNDLLGAQFELYRGSVADANKIWFTLGAPEGGVPVLIVAGQGATAPVTGAFSTIALTDDSTVTNYLNSTKVIIKGLDKEAYVLHETEAPAGYNPADDQTVAAATLVDTTSGTITDTTGIDSDAAVANVVNQTGTELPSTGGMGTKILYAIGAVLVIGAVVILVTKKRAEA